MNTVKTKKHFDLNKIKNIVFKDIDLLLKRLDLEYETENDNVFMCCPIHTGSDNPKGVSISKNNRYWKCWTRGCEIDYGSDIFGFVRGVLSKYNDEASFVDALNLVKRVYGIDYSNSGKFKVTINNNSNNNELSSIVKIFNKSETEDNSNIEVNSVRTIGRSKYFEQRGFSPDTLKLFGIEDCEDKSSAMYHRSVIPVHSFDGNLKGLIGRSNKQYLLPKYIYTKGLRKSYYLYNHHRAIDTALQKHCFFITEGQGDVWRLYESGVVNAIGLLGRDLSIHQRDKLIRSGVTTLVVLTDNDQSGKESKLKIYRDLNRMFRIIFPRMTKKDIGEMSVEKVVNDILPQVKGLY
jgi:DNA primase